MLRKTKQCGYNIYWFDLIIFGNGLLQQNSYNTTVEDVEEGAEGF